MRWGSALQFTFFLHLMCHLYLIWIYIQVDEAELALLSSPPHVFDQDWFMITRIDLSDQIVQDVISSSCQGERADDVMHGLYGRGLHNTNIWI